jgi:hypothetical protein
MRIFPILLGAGAAAVVGVSAFASEAHPQNHGAQVSALAQSATPGAGHGAAVSKLASQNRANDSNGDEAVEKTAAKPAITPNLSTACSAAIAKVKALRAQDAADDAKERTAAETEEASETDEASEANDAAEDAAEQAAEAAEQGEDSSEMTDMANAVKAAWSACRNTAVAHSDACTEAKEVLSQFTQWEANRRLNLPTTVTSRIQQAIAQACA